MILQNIDLFVKTLKVNEGLNAVRYSWNPLSHRLISTESHFKKRSRHRFLFFHALSLLVLGLQSVTLFGTKANTSHSKVSRSESFLYWQGLFFIAVSHITLHCCNYKAESICAYVNGLISFQKKHAHSYKQAKSDTIPLIIVHLIRMSAYTFPLFYPIALHWNNSCKPSVVGYWLLAECNGSSQLSHIIIQLPLKLLIKSINVWMWIFAYHNDAYLICIVLFVMGVNTMRQAIDL